MAHQERGHGVDTAEVLIEESGGRGRNAAGLGLHFVGPFEPCLITGPHHRDSHEQHQQERCDGDLSKNGLRAKELQRFPREF